jgi:ubiquinone/menaquinone biosynthesis C-methylase UbiE
VGLYRKHVLPRLVDRLCGLEAVSALRAEVVPQAGGRVLEVGFGTGLNLPFYDRARVERLFALEPAQEMLERARERSRGAPFPVEPVPLEGERIPLETASVDSVVVTFTLCTIPDPQRALEGMRRVLRPGGRLLFCEHGLAPDASVARWQRRVNPLWRHAFGGCHLDRDVPALLAAGGFQTRTLEKGWLEGGPRIASYVYYGAAAPAP